MDQNDMTQDITMDLESLSREEIFTDSRIGTIRRLTPVTPEGDVDESRPVQYFGSTQIMTPAGALPLNFELPGGSLQARPSKVSATRPRKR